MCIRNMDGSFIAARASYSLPRLPVLEGEASGLWQALQWVQSLDFHNVIFELDCKCVVDSFNYRIVDISKFGSIIHECSKLLSSFPNFRVKFIRKQANRVAHSLAKVALSKSNPAFIMMFPCVSLL